MALFGFFLGFALGFFLGGKFAKKIRLAKKQKSFYARNYWRIKRGEMIDPWGRVA